MKIMRFVAIAILTVTMSISGAYAAVLEMPLVLKTSDNYMPSPMANILMPDFRLWPTNVMDVTPAGIVAHIVEVIPTIEGLHPIDFIPGPQSEEWASLIEGEDVEIIIVQDQEGFWSARRIRTILAVLALTGLVVLFIGILASASGAGSGAGSGAESGSGPSLGPLGGPPPGNPEGDPPLNDPVNDPDGKTPLVPPVVVIPPGSGGPGPTPFVPGGTGPGPSGIPHTPEPSTLLLTGIGLLIPFLRKRRK